MALLHRLLFPTLKLSSKKTEPLRGKTVVITGASYGIGEAVSLYLAGLGCRLALVARTREKLLEVQRECLEKGAADCQIFSTDFYDLEQVRTLAIALEAEYKELDFFISNAGKSIMRSFADSRTRWQDIRRTTAINYTAPVYLIQYLYPLLRKKKGRVINVSALSVLMPPTPYWAAYESSKKAFDNWCRCNAPEWERDGVKLRTIYPPLVKTRMSGANKRYDRSPKMKVEQAAVRIVRLMVATKRTEKPWWTHFFPLLFPFKWLWAKNLVRHYQK